MPAVRVRADWTLRALLEKTKALGGSEHVHRLIDDALTHMGPRSPYSGGRDLISLLRYGHNAARQEEDVATAERIEDAIAYALNTMLRPDVEIKYQLLPGTRKRQRTFVQRSLSTFGTAASDCVREILAENPEATVEDIQSYFAAIVESANRVEEDERQPGRYKLLVGRDEMQAWLEERLFAGLAAEMGGVLATIDTPAATGQATLADLARIAQLKIRRQALRDLRSVVNNPHSLERDLQQILEENLWVFGGSFVPQLGRRRLVSENELDIPLLRPDGSLHVLELKRANVGIVTRQRNGLIPNAEVHRAVGQAMNYLLVLDEDRTRILDEFGVDVRRARATVLIGHPQFRLEFDEVQVDGVLRTYNSHLARVEVITYKQLLDSAHRSMDLIEQADPA